MLSIKQAIKRRFTMPHVIPHYLEKKRRNAKINFFTQMLLVESAAAVGLCCMHNAPVQYLPERKNYHM